MNISFDHMIGVSFYILVRGVSLEFVLSSKMNLRVSQTENERMCDSGVWLRYTVLISLYFTPLLALP